MSELMNHVSEKVLSDYDHLRDDCGLIDLGNWSLLELSGDDRKGWLQGQITNDLRRFESGASTSFCVCAPTGQLLCAYDAWALGDRFAITCDKGGEAALIQRVAQMVILEDVKFADVSKAYRMFSIQGPSATKRLGEFVDLPNLDAGQATLFGSEVLLLRSNRTGLGGWDVWFKSTRRKLAEQLRAAIPGVGQGAYQAARLEAGYPAFGKDYDARTLPPELGEAFEARHISYSKGCYTGQEVLMRMHSRGHANRQWVGLLTDSEVPAGSVVKHRVRGEVGKVTSAANSPDYGPIAGAMIRKETAEEREELWVVAPGGEVPAEVKRMPILRLG